MPKQTQKLATEVSATLPGEARQGSILCTGSSVGAPETRLGVTPAKPSAPVCGFFCPHCREQTTYRFI